MDGQVQGVVVAEDEVAKGNARRRAIVRVLVWTLFANYAVAAAKLFYAWKTGALAFSADGIHSLLDGTSNVVGLVGMRLASKPADEGHPYGHQRFEALAALAIGALILGGLWAIAGRAVAALASDSAVVPGWSALGVAGGTLVVNVAVARYEARRGQALRSSILTADASHTAADSLGTLAILVSFFAARLGFRYADPVAALVIAVLIARTAWRVLRDNVAVLADERRIEPGAIHKIAVSVDGVHGAHKIRSRGSLDHVAVDLHIHVDPHMTVEHAHKITHAVADRIRDELSEVHDVVIHTEPADGRERE